MASRIPLIFAGIRISALFVVSTTTIAALTGYSGSLGDIINNETSYHLAGVLGAAICIAALRAMRQTERPPPLTLDQVAERLHKSRRWLQGDA